MIDKFIVIFVIFIVGVLGVCFIFVGIPMILSCLESRPYSEPLALKHSIQLEEIERRLKKLEETK